jgi:hypothetical protein
MARPRWRVLSLIMAMAVVAACEELGTSSVETGFGTTLTLTTDQPVVTRSVDYVAEAGAQPVYGAMATSRCSG